MSDIWTQAKRRASERERYFASRENGGIRPNPVLQAIATDTRECIDARLKGDWTRKPTPLATLLK